MLASAFNAVTAIHSRAVMLKRLGSPAIYSPARVTPSNFFRFLQGPEYTTIKGAEFIIPVATMFGQYAQLLTFSGVPTSGEYKIKFGVQTTTALNFDADAATIQTALRLLTGLTNVLVEGGYLIGFTITFVGFATAPELGMVVDSDLDDGSPVTTSFVSTHTKWSNLIKKGDRIVESHQFWIVDEVIEMHDLGTAVIGYRVRVEKG